jgi:hypothetical protein
MQLDEEYSHFVFEKVRGLAAPSQHVDFEGVMADAFVPFRDGFGRTEIYPEDLAI